MFAYEYKFVLSKSSLVPLLCIGGSKKGGGGGVCKGVKKTK